MERKVRPKRVQIPVDDTVTLEGLVCVPEEGTEESKIGVVLSHPHPMLGGNMTNNVIGSLLKGLGKEGYCTLCFNFRGTGQSTGKGTWRGGGEREDIKGVCKYLEKEYGVERIILVGYSYGAAISCSVMNELEIVKGAVAISYPFGVLTVILLGHLLEMAKTSKPIFWVIGAKDNFTSSARFLERVKSLSQLGVEELDYGEEGDHDAGTKHGEKEENRTEDGTTSSSQMQVLKIVPGFDHFWFGGEDLLEDYIVSWLDQVFSHQHSPNNKL